MLGSVRAGQSVFKMIPVIREQLKFEEVSGRRVRATTGRVEAEMSAGRFMNPCVDPSRRQQKRSRRKWLHLGRTASESENLKYRTKEFLANSSLRCAVRVAFTCGAKTRLEIVLVCSKWID